MKGDYQPLITVIIPTYNSAEYLEATVQSVLQQSYRNFELLLVDDGSSDTTLELNRRFEQLDSRVRALDVGHSGMPAVPFNHGMRVARGELVAFLGSDDVWLPHKLEDQVAFLARHPEYLFVYSASFTFGAVNFFSPKYELLPLPFRAARTRQELIAIGNTVPASSVLARLSAVRDAGYYEEDPGINEDYDLWIKLAALGPFGYLPRIQVLYHIHDAQISGSWETRARRIEYYAEKTGLAIARHKGFRNKGLAVRLIRNSVHAVCKNYYYALALLERRTGWRLYD